MKLGKTDVCEAVAPNLMPIIFEKDLQSLSESGTSSSNGVWDSELFLFLEMRL